MSLDTLRSRARARAAGRSGGMAIADNRLAMALPAHARALADENITSTPASNFDD